MTFTYSLADDIGKVRFELGDSVASSGVRPGGVNFTDEEITAVLGSEPDVTLAVTRLLDVLSREWAQVVDITLGPRKESFSQVSKAYAQLAARLRDDVGVGSPGTNLRFNRQDGYRTAHERAPYAGHYVGWRHSDEHGEY